MDRERLRRHAGRIRKIGAAIEDFRVYAGIEVDILEDGGLDLDGDALADLDWVVASIHSHFDQSKRQMTRRLRRAIDSGVIDCLGHPCSRLLGSRGPIRFDTGEVFSACAEAGGAAPASVTSRPTWGALASSRRWRSSSPCTSAAWKSRT